MGTSSPIHVEFGNERRISLFHFKSHSPDKAATWVEPIDIDILRFVLTGFCVAIVLCNLLGCAGPAEPQKRSDLEEKFRDEFGFAPTASVSNIQCKVVQVRNTWGKWLAFNYEPPTFQRITNQSFNLLNAKSSSDLGRLIWASDFLSLNPNEPPWWRRALLGERTIIYYKEGDVKNFNRSYTVLWLNSSNQTVYARSAAWD